MVPGYREVRELGTGSGGRVVLATYIETGAYVAIKYLNATMKDDPGFLRRLRREARALVEIDDPNVVRLYEYYEDVLDAAIVMELVDGVPLRKLLAERRTTSPEAALAVLRSVLLGLSKAHALGIAHRDCRPENVLVQADGTSKLSDVGIAVPAGEPGGPAGAPPYLAPERWSGHPAGPAADVYAAACVFFECLTGRTPYRADHPAALSERHRTAPIPVEAVPEPVRRVVARGLAKDPVDRPPTARAFLAEVEAAALAGYGPQWEQRGRRHLAELATPLALAFPLARAAPRAGAAVARSVLGRMGRLRPTRRPGTRLVAAASVMTVAVATALISAGRPNDPIASDTVFTPGPGAPEAGRGGAPRGTADSPPGPRRSRDVAADSPVPSGGTSAPAPVPARSSVAAQERSPATPAGPPAPTTRPSAFPTPTGGPSSPPPPSPTGTRVSGSPKPSGPRHTVSGLAVAGIDGQGATIALRASTTAEVAVTVRFAEGPDPDRLTEAPPRTLTLSGSETYVQVVPHRFTDPPCEQVLVRRVTVSTSPQAPDGAQELTVEAAGAPCRSPGPTGGTPDAPQGGGDPAEDPIGDDARDPVEEPPGDPVEPDGPIGRGTVVPPDAAL
ncbi:serine/threonine-protein kinase [Planobispora rosea]|uniref:serine/threonine-protein kinase n=1 Tax=Planobispora rosea TaxID=35762 RepID=UPI00083A56E0|nr:serine/threonine-protein kinase [Planobispora rosea]